jgi:hypothetical protein
MEANRCNGDVPACVYILCPTVADAQEIMNCNRKLADGAVREFNPHGSPNEQSI